MRLLPLLLLLCLLGFWPASALEPPYLVNAVQDGRGVLWAYGGGADTLYRFDGKQWNEAPRPPDLPEGASPQGMVRMTDGAVACVWRLSVQRMAVTRHAERTSLLGIVDSGVLEGGAPATFLADSHNRLWIVGKSADICRADADGVSVVRRIAPGELDLPTRAKLYYNAVHAAEDGRGRVWVWSDPSASSCASLRRALIFTEEGVESHDLTASIKPGAKVLAIARADERHMWMAVENQGIYRLDIDTLVPERLTAPSPDALGQVHELFVDGNDLYAIDEAAGRDATSLWRWRDGRWTRLVEPLDQTTSRGWEARSWLSVKEGILVQAYPSNPWFVPHEGEPVRLSWRTSFPLEAARAFARLADGSFFAIGHDNRFFHGPINLPPRERQNPRLLDLDSTSGWVLDANGRPWTTLKQTPESISEWDGERWIAHAIPGGEGLLYPQSITSDKEGRIWVNVGYVGPDHPTSTFDTKTGGWQTFADTPTAYLALRDHPPHFLSGRMLDTDPQYSADRRRLAYRSSTNRLLYYDGSAWQQFDRSQIAGKSRDGAVGPPWFDAEDRLRVNLRPGTSWRRDDAGQWSEVAFQSRFPADIWSEQSGGGAERPVPPEGCVTAEPDSIVVDNLGTFWLTWGQELYRCVPNRCVKVFGADEPNPFITGQQLDKVFVDPGGNAFLLTVAADYHTFIVKPKSPPPRTALALEPVGADSMKIRLHTEAGAPTQFRWRLDDGPWRVTSDDLLALAGLPDGSHTVAVAGTDAELQTEAVPAVATFQIRIDPEQQMAGLITQLSDPDYAQRKAAVYALALQPGYAESALRHARAVAEDDQQWWIDAALQQVEAAKRSTKNR